ncbi:MAG: XdhC family protein [Pleurocapsa sp. MO_192.B19]|nr:XdhC family protein [Pleurocapsa sp. MO_192.B19]
MSDPNFYQQLRSILETEAVVVATIVEVIGSAPREVGAKMAICRDGSIIGTIGGGAGEGKVIKEALTVLKTGKKQLIEIDLTGTPGKDIQGVCGGKVQVWLEKWSGEKALTLVEQILELFKTGQSGTLVTSFIKNTQPYLMGYPLGCAECNRNFTHQKNETHLSFSSASSGRKPCTNTASSAKFIETIQPPPILLIVGGGHVALSLAQIASLAGFQIAVQDDRPEFVTPQRFPQALLFPQPITTALDAFAAHSQLYVALVTRGYPQDIEALQAILQRPLGYQYIGAIGSQKRIRMISQALQQQGISLEKLPDFHAPIGLDIGALTPEEIAVSICGELIKVRRGGTGLSLCERMQHSKKPSKVHIGELLYARWQ